MEWWVGVYRVNPEAFGSNMRREYRSVMIASQESLRAESCVSVVLRWLVNGKVVGEGYSEEFNVG
jgi:hypothetical protein